jgi:hypothetical protein
MPAENHHVFFEAGCGMSLLESMKQLRPWLKRNKIKPIGLKHTITNSGAIEFQLTFKNRHEARLFEHAFCNVEQT